MLFLVPNNRSRSYDSKFNSMHEHNLPQGRQHISTICAVSAAATPSIYIFDQTETAHIHVIQHVCVVCLCPDVLLQLRLGQHAGDVWVKGAEDDPLRTQQGRQPSVQWLRSCVGVFNCAMLLQSCAGMAKPPHYEVNTRSPSATMAGVCWQCGSANCCFMHLSGLERP